MNPGTASTGVGLDRLYHGSGLGHVSSVSIGPTSGLVLLESG